MFSDELKKELSLLYPEFKNYNINQIRIKLEDILENYEENIIGKVSDLREDIDLIISKEDIKTMVKTNPERVLCLKPLSPESFPIKESEGVEKTKNR